MSEWSDGRRGDRARQGGRHHLEEMGGDGLPLTGKNTKTLKKSNEEKRDLSC